MSRTNFLIVISWVVAAIAIALLWLWRSPSTESLVRVDISIGLAAIICIFNIGMKVMEKLSSVEKGITDKISGAEKGITDKLSDIGSTLVRIEALLRSSKG